MSVDHPNEDVPAPQLDDLHRLLREFGRAEEALRQAVVTANAAVAEARAQHARINLAHIQKLAKIEGVADTLAACEIMAAITEFAVATADADATDQRVGAVAREIERAMTEAVGISELFVEATANAAQEAAETSRRALAALAEMQARRQEHAINNKDVRRKVWALTSGHCIYCNVPMALEIREHEDWQRQFHIDHIVPKAHGGPDHISNYVPACRACNIEKRDLPVAEFITLKHMKQGKLVLMKVLPQTGQPTDAEFSFAVEQLQKYGPAMIAEDVAEDASASKAE